ncbi:MAG TPA: zinc metallopeptidase, partial [candidate division Zixibacteria bacterium]|nr:zinc metallopeptidase [candidate division Zixibacteria bacterium]
MFFWDPTFVLLIPALILAMWAQGKLSRTYQRFSEERTTRRITGYQTARRMLDSAGLSSVDIERTAGNLTDHYDPRSRILRLSQGVYSSDSIAAVGIAAHEVGHAIQHKNAYAPLAVRNAIVPVVSFGSWLAWPLFIIGFLFRTPPLIQLGIILFSGAVVFQLVTLP